MFLSQTNKISSISFYNTKKYFSLFINRENLAYIKKLKLLSENFVKKAVDAKKARKGMNINYFINNAVIYKTKRIKFSCGTSDNLSNLLRINDLTNTVSYTLTMREHKTNLFFIFATVFKVTKLNYSAGLLKLKKKQRKKRPSVYFHMIKYLVQKLNSTISSPVVLHFDNITKADKNTVLRKLLPIFNFSAIKNFLLKPHNGCRGKKLKRIKKRTKSS